MKRIAIVVLLLLVAGVAGIVRSHSRGGRMEGLVSHQNEGESRDEIRRSFVLSPGATVEVSGINGTLTVETSDTKTAEVYIERTGATRESLERRKINIEADANGLRISTERGEAGFLARLFTSNPSERVLLKLPRKISLNARGVNGAVNVGDVDGPVEVHGVNGRVQVSSVSGSGEFSGINGNVMVGLKQPNPAHMSITGINGNIELRVAESVNADVDAHGMNGRVVSDASDIRVEQTNRGNYSAHIGNGGSAIAVSGINGNVRLTRTETSAEGSNGVKTVSVEN